MLTFLNFQISFHHSPQNVTSFSQKMSDRDTRLWRAMQRVPMGGDAVQSETVSAQIVAHPSDIDNVWGVWWLSNCRFPISLANLRLITHWLFVFWNVVNVITNYSNSKFMLCNQSFPREQHIKLKIQNMLVCNILYRDNVYIIFFPTRKLDPECC